MSMLGFLRKKEGVLTTLEDPDGTAGSY